MHRPKPKLSFLLKKLINEELKKFVINKVLNSQETEYIIIKNNLSPQDYNYDIYRFTTKHNNSYDVEFYKEEIYFKFVKIKNNNTLPDKFNDYETLGIIVGFTPTEIAKKKIPDKIIGTLKDPYIRRTNRNEQYEVFGKIIFLIQEYIKNNSNYYVFIILKNTYDNNLLIYNSIYNNIFKNDFDVYENENAYYYLKK